jgi:hypothetical protein
MTQAPPTPPEIPPLTATQQPVYDLAREQHPADLPGQIGFVLAKLLPVDDARDILAALARDYAPRKATARLAFGRAEWRGEGSRRTAMTLLRHRMMYDALKCGLGLVAAPSMSVTWTRDINRESRTEPIVHTECEPDDPRASRVVVVLTAPARELSPPTGSPPA